MLIGICGLIGSGKDTIAAYLVEQHSYERYSWATPLKDITATLFGWDREMLEGTTSELRANRELKDDWWSEKLNRDWSPRKALQHMGTEVMRDALHPAIWVLAGQRRIAGKSNVVIPDTRFPNEIEAIREMGGQIWRVKRGDDPEWFQKYRSHSIIPQDVHPSEYMWANTDFDHEFCNDSNIDDLTNMVGSVISNRSTFSARHRSYLGDTVGAIGTQI